jgi:hypothetical protein
MPWMGMHSFPGTVELKTFAEGIRMIQNPIKVLMDNPIIFKMELLTVPDLQRMVVK